VPSVGFEMTKKCSPVLDLRFSIVTPLSPLKPKTGSLSLAYSDFSAKKNPSARERERKWGEMGFLPLGEISLIS